MLGQLKIIRGWAALRIKIPDKMPFYEGSGSSPQVIAFELQRGVTPASLHATKMVNWILDGCEPAVFKNFRARRFDV